MRGVFAALALIGSLAAGQAQTSGTREEQAACRPDVRKFCGQIGKKDDQNYRDCLQKHVAELSQKCRDVLQRHANSQ